MRRDPQRRPGFPPATASGRGVPLADGALHAYIEIDLADPHALEQEWNYTDRAERFFRTGYRLLVRGFFEEAEDIFHRATRYAPSHYRATVGRIETLILLGRTDAATTVANEGLARYGRNCELGSARGHVYLHVDDLDHALQCADVATESVPESTYAWLIAGEVRLAMAEAYWSAQECFERARQSPDGWPFLELRIALALLEWGHIEHSLGALQKVLDVEPNLPLAWILMGDAHKIRNDRRGFKRCYARALELVPDLEPLRRALSWKTSVSEKWRRFRRTISRAFSSSGS